MTTETIDKPTRQSIDKNTINKMVSLSAEGKPQTVIARKLNVNQSTVSKYVNQPENKELEDVLKDRLREKYVTQFVARKERDEEEALKVTEYAYNPTTVENKTIYQTPDQIEKYLGRQDKCGLKIAEGTGVLKSNTIQFGDDNSQHLTVMSPSYQAFIDFQNDRSHDDNKEGES